MKSVPKMTLIGAMLMASGVSRAVTVDMYGFLKASFLHSDNSISSFGIDSVHAPTEAANQRTASATQDAEYKKQSKDSFQVAQSRFGVVLKKNEKLSGKIEFDMVDFTNHPIGKNSARVRLVEVLYDFNEKVSMRIGQGWSTFAGLPVHSFNIVGGTHRSGGSGFLAQQAELKYKLGEWSFYGSLAQKGRNTTGYTNNSGANTVPTQDVSSRGLPQANVKAEYLTKVHKAGVAYTYARFDFDNAPTAAVRGDSSHSYGAKAYYQGTFGKFEFRSEIYQGANLNDLYFLTLAERSLSAVKYHDLQELGYFVSGKYIFEGGHYTYGGYGSAEITSSLSRVMTDKIVSNSHTRLGYAYVIEEGFVAFLEGTRYETGYKKGSGKDKSLDHALMVESGVQYIF